MLTPVDIQNKEFERAFRGYDPQEVDDFLRDVLADYERLYRENATLKEKAAMREEAIAQYKTMEDTMQNALVVAQHTAEDIKSGAYGKAENIVKEAQLQAEEIIAKANAQISSLSADYSRLFSEMEAFRARMNALLASYSEMLKEIPSQREIDLKVPEIAAAAPAAPVKTPEPPAPREKEYDIFGGVTLPHEEAQQVEQQDTRPVPDLSVAEKPFEHVPKPNPLVEELMARAKTEQEPPQPDQTEQAVQTDEPVREMVFQIEKKVGESFDVFKEDPLE